MNNMPRACRVIATALTIVAAFVTNALAASYVVLHELAGPDGASPNAIILGTDGFFYGSTGTGGDTSVLPDGFGTLYRMDATGNFTQLHVFHAIDGYSPTGLVQGRDGLFYGTTNSGGAPSGGGPGVIFRINPAGSFTVLYAFQGGFACCDGGGPSGPPIEGSDGFFYGVTGGGGQFRDIDHQGGFGTVYRLDPASGAVTILHSFSLADGNGIFPNGPLVQGADGFLYGTTREGPGTIYKIDTAGNLTLLHRITDSGEPLSGLLAASDGFFYGTTNGPPGSVFRVSPSGSYSVVNRFDGLDGYGLRHGLMQAGDGALYGSGFQGGIVDFQGGTLFRLDVSRDARILRSLSTTDHVGYIPNARLTQGADGALYGTTGLGGTNRLGTIFRLDPRVSGPVASIGLQPSHVKAGESATGTVTLSSPAPRGGTVVTLAATSFGVSVPATMTVAAKQTSATFPIQTSATGFTQDARVYALIGGEGPRAVLGLDQVVGVSDPRPIADLALALRSPNPTSGAVEVEYEVPGVGQVQVAVFDMVGRRVATLASGPLAPGRHHASWTGARGARPGLYFVRLMTPGRSLTQRVAIVR